MARWRMGDAAFIRQPRGSILRSRTSGRGSRTEQQPSRTSSIARGRTPGQACSPDGSVHDAESRPSTPLNLVDERLERGDVSAGDERPVIVLRDAALLVGLAV